MKLKSLERQKILKYRFHCIELIISQTSHNELTYFFELVIIYPFIVHEQDLFCEKLNKTCLGTPLFLHFFTDCLIDFNYYIRNYILKYILIFVSIFILCIGARIPQRRRKRLCMYVSVKNGDP